MCVYARQREKGSALHNIKYTFVCTLFMFVQVRLH